MARQSITVTKPNDEWLKAQVERQEYLSKSEVINDLIRRERERQNEFHRIRAKLIEGEQSGFMDASDIDREKILSNIKDRAKRSGKL